MISNTRQLESLTLSVVSHGQGRLVRRLLEDLEPLHGCGCRVLLTLNVPEDETFLNGLSSNIIVLRNPQPQGFGANHNQAFGYAPPERGFVVVNPDVRLDALSTLTLLLESLRNDKTGAVAPRVLAPSGRLEDSARRFPTFPRLAIRSLRRCLRRPNRPDYALDIGVVEVDWVAGMFVMYAREAFEEVGGFDERYFMYLEDADICRRLGAAGWRTVLQTKAAVIHDAQRASGRSARHLLWHLQSMSRFFFAP